MKKVFRVIMMTVAAVSGAIVGKLIYDAVSEKKKREEKDREFLDDIEEDFAGLNAVMPQAVQNSSKEQEEKEETVKTPGTKGTAKTDSKETSAAEAQSKPKTAEAAQDSIKTSNTPAKPKAVKKVNVSGTKTAAKEKKGVGCLDVIDAVAEVMSVSAEDILSKSRKGDVANARRIAIYLCAADLDVSNAEICEAFGGIGAASVTNAKKIIADKLKEDDELAADIEDITDELKQRTK